MAKGGKRPGAGRPKGAVNKVTADVRVLAQKHTAAALDVLANIMMSGESEASRVAAANSLLDRAHGKPAQTLTGDPQGAPLTFQIVTGVPRAGD